MRYALIQHKKSGDCYLALLNDDGDVVLSTDCLHYSQTNGLIDGSQKPEQFELTNEDVEYLNYSTTLLCWV